MKFVFTLLSLLFLPILSFKEIKPKCCINCKPFNEHDKFKKYSLLIKEQINDVYSLLNEFGKMYTKKYIKPDILNEKESEPEKDKDIDEHYID
jgi:uncharacterized protein YllA (UPF0747 family)